MQELQQGRGKGAVISGFCCRTSDSGKKKCSHLLRASSSPPEALLPGGEAAVNFAILARTGYRLLDEGDLQETRIRGCVWVSAEEIRRVEEFLVEAEHYRK